MLLKARINRTVLMRGLATESGNYRADLLPAFDNTARNEEDGLLLRR